MKYFWFRRDLRLNDNVGLRAALQSGEKVQPVFIFDEEILNELPKNDARVTFIHTKLEEINEALKQYQSSILVKHGKPLEIWKDLVKRDHVNGLFFNHDYEPYALQRDKVVTDLFEKEGHEVKSFKDHVFFEKNEVLKEDGDPYVVYTPYKNKWLEKLKAVGIEKPEKEEQYFKEFLHSDYVIPSLSSIGFEKSTIEAPAYNLKYVKDYDKHRNDPAADRTTQIGHHLRFGTVSIRALVAFAKEKNHVFLSELIWRDFFSQILYHFPKVVDQNFREKYNGIEWRNNEEEFKKWCEGKTGYPIVDAGMRQLKETGFMHNRVRMITGSFLVKHLLVDWRWGEAYFAEKLLDYDLASNNGNWQWVAGTGCDAAPYFRVFNPSSQQDKFDKDYAYVKRWVKEYGTEKYPQPMVDHKMARQRALDTYKKGIEG